MRRHLVAAAAGGVGAALAGLVSCSTARSQPLPDRQSGVLTPTVFATYLTACAKQYPVILQAPVRRQVAHAMAESGMWPNALRDNATGHSYFPATPAEAVALARQFLLAGHKIDAGVMQVDSANWPAYGLTVETAFDPRANICAGARILGEAFQIERRAACRYNTGKPDCGPAYPDMVQRAEARLGQATPAVVLEASPPSPPPPPLCAPAWDAWALATCSARRPSPQRAPSPAEGVASAPVVPVVTASKGISDEH